MKTQHKWYKENDNWWKRTISGDEIEKIKVLEKSRTDLFVYKNWVYCMYPETQRIIDEINE